MNKASVTLMVLAVAGLVGCEKEPRVELSRKAPAPVAVQPMEGPMELGGAARAAFRDLVLFIDDDQKLPGGGHSLRAFGLHGGKKVGCEIVLQDTWIRKQIEPHIHQLSYRGTVTFRSPGPAGDAFVTALDELFGTGQAPKRMRAETAFTGITLGSDPRDLGRGAVRMRLVHDTGKTEQYAQQLALIDLARRRIDLNEVNPDYRLPLVRALSGD